MSREAMKMALDALVFARYEDKDYDDVCDQKVREARDALRQALETEQEPVARREWVGLTDEEMEALFLNEDDVKFARYIESRLKDKNA